MNTLTIKQEEYAVVPILEYQALLNIADDAADIDSIAKCKNAIIKDQDELIPNEFAERIIDGESPVRVYREYRNITLSELAKISGITQSGLSMIENGKREPKITTAAKIAEALDIDIDDLV
jgi:DNA-binding XRE family transcriptional regulator